MLRSRPLVARLKISNTSIGSDRADNSASRSSRSGILALEVGQESGIHHVKAARATKSIELAIVSEVASADIVCRGRGRCEDLTTDRGQQRSDDVLEDITLGDDLGARLGVKGMPTVGVPVIVHCMQEGIAAYLGAATGGVMNVVAFHGDEVAATIEVEGPVVVSVAGGGPACHTVDLVVGDGDAIRG